MIVFVAYLHLRICFALDLIDTVYSESTSYVSGNDLEVLDLKTGARLIPFREDCDILSSIGPVNNAIQLIGKSDLRLMSPPCFDQPSLCLRGLSVSFWIKLPANYNDKNSGQMLFLRPMPASVPGPLYSSHFRKTEGVGFGAILSDKLHADIQIYVSSQTRKCFYGFPVATQSWNHVTMVWLNRKTITVFLNGQRLPTAASCTPVEGSLKIKTTGSVRIGGPKLDIWLDEFAIWNKALSDEEAVNIYYRTNIGKNKQ